MEEIWDQETRTDNEAAHHWSAAVTNLVVRSSIHISLLKRRCGEWKAKWWWWWIPSFDIDSNAEGSLAMMCLSLGWLVSTTFVCVHVCDVIWLSKLTDLSFSLPLYGCRSPPASFVPFWQSCALLFPRGHVLFHLFFLFLKAGFPRVSRGLKKKKSGTY